MRSAEFVDKLAKLSRINPYRARMVLKSLYKILHDMEDGDIIHLPLIGKFDIISTKDRKRHNLHDGGVYIIKGDKKLRFRPSGKLKRWFNKDRVVIKEK